MADLEEYLECGLLSDDDGYAHVSNKVHVIHVGRYVKKKNYIAPIMNQITASKQIIEFWQFISSSVGKLPVFWCFQRKSNNVIYIEGKCNYGSSLYIYGLEQKQIQEKIAKSVESSKYKGNVFIISSAIKKENLCTSFDPENYDTIFRVSVELI